MKVFLVRFGSPEHAKAVADRLKREGVSGRTSIILSSSFPSATMFTRTVALYLGTLVEFSDVLRVERPDYVQNDRATASLILNRQAFHKRDVIVIIHDEQAVSLPSALAEWQQEVIVTSQNQIIKIDFEGKVINLLPLQAA